MLPNNEEHLRYLRVLARQFPTVAAAASEIIRIEAITRLPKGTEHFMSDLHGENEAFLHILNSASGVIREKIDLVLGEGVPAAERAELATLIYYPAQKLPELKARQADLEGWYRKTLLRLIELCRQVSSKHTRAHVRRCLPQSCAYILDELLHAHFEDHDKDLYYGQIIDSILRYDRADAYVIRFCEVIKHLAVDRLHILGDLFDRGPRPDLILDQLMAHHDVDIQWGNHDISWMGAATGNPACVCNVVRIAISYNSFDVLEDGYGINLRPLSMFAAHVYRDDPCEKFAPKILDENIYDAVDPGLAARMHKAIAVIQFKVEGQIIKRHPEYEMEDRLLLEAVDYEKGTVTAGGIQYPMTDTKFPTIDPKNPYELTKEEQDLLNTLVTSFGHSELLHRHINFLYSHGSMYKRYNSNLLFHGCIPMKEDGSFEGIELEGKLRTGKSLMDSIERQIKAAYFLPDGSAEKENAKDFMWYLWCGAKSPLFGKDRMATFENYFIEDKAAHKERMNPYYKLSVEEKYCDQILEEFGLPKDGSHIINGHVPVKIKDGEKPVKAGGKLYIIDGGLSKAYQSKTGIAGYTLIYNSNHLALAEHKPFHRDQESTPKVYITEKMANRIRVADTDLGKELAGRIDDLKELVAAYRAGVLKES